MQQRRFDNGTLDDSEELHPKGPNVRQRTRGDSNSQEQEPDIFEHPLPPECQVELQGTTCLWRIDISLIIPEDFPSCYAFCEAQSGRSFHPLQRPRPVAPRESSVWWTVRRSCMNSIYLSFFV